MKIGLPARPSPPPLQKKKKDLVHICWISHFPGVFTSSTNNFAADLARETQLGPLCISGRGESLRLFWSYLLWAPTFSLGPSHLQALLGCVLTDRKISFAVHLFDQAFTFYVRSLNMFFLGYRVLSQGSQVKTLTWPFPDEIFSPEQKSCSNMIQRVFHAWKQQSKTLEALTY